MKDIKTFLLIIICTIFLLFLFYYKNKITEKDNAYGILSHFTASVQMRDEIYYFNFELNNKMTGLFAPNIYYSETKDNKKGNYLVDFVKNKPILIYRYSDINCTTCYETEIKELQAEFINNPELSIILCSYRIDQEFLVFKRINQIKLSLYRINSDAFDWEVEKYGNPYYFVLHPNMKISHIYVPNKSYPELNKQYLEGVKRFLSE